MRHDYRSVLLLLASYTSEAGCYDEPSFLTSHLVSGRVSEDGIPTLTNPTFLAPNKIGYLAEDDVVIGIVHQRRTVSVSAQHRLVE